METRHATCDYAHPVEAKSPPFGSSIIAVWTDRKYYRHFFIDTVAKLPASYLTCQLY